MRARSVRNVKEGALGRIPKSYPLCFSVDGGKKSRTTIGAEQTHRSRWAQGPRDGRQGSIARGQGWRALGGEGGGGGRRTWVRCSSVHVCCSGCYSGTVDVQRLAVLLRSMEHAEVHFLSPSPGVHRARTHALTRTHTQRAEGRMTTCSSPTVWWCCGNSPSWITTTLTCIWTFLFIFTNRRRCRYSDSAWSTHLNVWSTQQLQ